MTNQLRASTLALLESDDTQAFLKRAIDIAQAKPIDGPHWPADACLLMMTVTAKLCRAVAHDRADDVSDIARNLGDLFVDYMSVDGIPDESPQKETEG